MGCSESIFGYQDLHVRLYYTAGKLNTYVGLSYKNKISPKQVDGAEADDVLAELAPKLQPGFLTNLDDFQACIDKEQNFVPYGRLLAQVRIFF